MQTLYEIHTYNRGNWQIDSIYDDRDLAVYEAHLLERNGRCTAVRVIKERYDPDRNVATAHVVYKSGGQDTAGGEREAFGRPRTPEPMPRALPLPEPRQPPAAAGTRPPAIAEMPARRYVMLALKAGGLILVGLMVLIAIEKLSEVI